MAYEIKEALYWIGFLFIVTFLRWGVPLTVILTILWLFGVI
jgi:hypothetical protein